jgi:hypothetical protein
MNNRTAISANMARIWAMLALLASIAACAKLDLGSGGGTDPTPFPSVTISPTTGPTPNACNTMSPIANTVLIAMGNLIGPVSIAPYGTINGYAVVENNQFPLEATLINQWMTGSGVTQPITTKNVLQFVNVDTAGSAHSAVGFTTKAFPPTPYTFPTADVAPVGSTISSKTAWSTGRVEAVAGSAAQCYSQTFALTAAGSYYFGDYDYYNLSNVRDVIVVATPGAIGPKTLRPRQTLRSSPYGWRTLEGHK